MIFLVIQLFVVSRKFVAVKVRQSSSRVNVLLCKKLVGLRVLMMVTQSTVNEEGWELV